MNSMYIESNILMNDFDKVVWELLNVNYHNDKYLYSNTIGRKEIEKHINKHSSY